MNKTVNPNELKPVDDVGPLYAPRQKVYPQSVSGTFRRIKWGLMAICLGIYYFLPFVRWNRGLGAPSQAVLIDLPNSRFYFFFIELWPQEVYYFTGLLIVAAVALFLMNSVGGRIWCGYLCPQTVWTDLFYAVERLIEGDRRERMKKAKSSDPLKLERVSEIVLKHSIWLMIAWWTGGAWVLYFNDAPTLVKELVTFQGPMLAYIWIGILTATTYILAGYMREQVCTYMCPWPRIQAALTDEWALNVTYRYDRGEKRTSVKKAAELRALGQQVGDCVDCYQCVAVCPTGIDIRNGPQMECIQCGLCIDACDNVMAKIGRPKRLIGYDNDINIHRRQEGKAPIYRIVRARTIVYSAIIAAIGGFMVYTLATRSLLDVNVLHDRNPVAVKLSDGSIRNAYTVRLLNKSGYDRAIAIDVEGPINPTMHVVGVDSVTPDRPIIVIPRDSTSELRLLVTAPAENNPEKSIPVRFHVMDIGLGVAASATDNFVAP
ncbi:cytochrome c oxidase accessory protein CcoG [Bradyrhizobium sp. WBOS7]|uniref:Cytochrome c oxidase accessory protein CcoG n=1 Tax=Bradyrhizobium betae TaxID=244734 RepID=A0AAE9NBG4_9BRAD|nr:MULTISPECIES: cytochrome c oxidase accessory protein CcoG [Bradyrhizobium]MDD1569693.1 cytochrome c oxidase accessory protein CcoG [Bradyrhizobium sp. WBOS1]UUO35822.1 cytochrome c oxidase accessory protein CcoG [Bradyrhizobium sp. WBOS01]MDD1526382.1 cytochrome c oxidase accessory protein CcoG [Bradyrhizobium sp. WBOS2]MDD1575792.1 cytochrome c oxidase accessory protein CcoG [Bradyrhizobium sp. WBOS7]MDD1599619.1 cytochrome c oxidase accessory protein CcoG [Bradyrhizobium sp. WBOS16]